MQRFFKTIAILSFILTLTSCGGSDSSSSANVGDPLAIDGTFLGKDNSSRDATVRVDGPNNSILIGLKTSQVDLILEGKVILSAIASSGKKMATGDITYNVDLKITKSTLTGFSVDGISKGTIIKKFDNSAVATYTCGFNFTTNSIRGTNTTDSDWSMSGTKAP
jgi:hypothetical protein